MDSNSIVTPVTPAANTSRTMVVVLGLDRAASETFCWALSPLNGQPALVRLLTRLRGGFAEAGWDICYGFVSRTCALEPELRRIGCIVCRLQRDHQPALLDQLACAFPNSATLMVYPEESLFPDCLFAHELFQKHIRTEADATHAPEYPPGFAPEIFQTAAIRRLVSLGVPSEAQRDPIGLMRIVNRVSSGEGQFEDLGFRLTKAAEELPGAPKVEDLPSSMLLTNIRAKLAAEATLSNSPRGDDKADASAGYRFKRELLRVDNELLARYGQRSLSGRTACTNTARHVLFTSLATAVSGAEICLASLIQHLPPASFSPVLAVSYPSSLSDTLESAAIAVKIAYADLSLLTPLNLAYFSALLAEEEIDLIHQDSFPIPSLIVAARQRNIPVIHHVRALYGRNAPEMLKFCSAVIAISEAVASDLRKSDLPDEAVRIIYDGIETSRFEPHNRRANTGTLIAMVARIAKQKRQDLLLTALPSVLGAFPEIKVQLVGDVFPDELSYYAELQQQIVRLGLEGHVDFLGFQPDVRPIYEKSDVLVLCTDIEPLGTVVLEGMAVGIPIVAPNRGGPAELMTNGREGLLYKPGDALDLSRAILTLLKSETLRTQMGSAGRRRAQQFDIARHVYAVTDLYRDVLAAGLQKPPTSQGFNV
ncbi:MAG: glycosyltransferase family 4 protein [Terriglobia bacterium]